MFGLLRRWREKRAERIQVPLALWQQVEASLPPLAWLNDAERQRLRTLARGFLAEKSFHGAQGFALDDEMLLAIALQACLLILQRGLAPYRPWVGVVVYPGDFIIPRSEVDEAGVVHEYDDVVLGEAWEGGPVLLSWQPRADTPAGLNVVLHEFAHKLDMETGEVDGLPVLAPGMSARAWAQALQAAFDDLCAQVDAGFETAIDPYASENPGEFFAVCTETFFELPATLQQTYPAVYQQLALLYGIDPLARAARVGGDGG